MKVFNMFTIITSRYKMTTLHSFFKLSAPIAFAKEAVAAASVARDFKFIGSQSRSELESLGKEIDLKSLSVASTLEVKPKLQTEDLGKVFEMAICLAYGIPFNGSYKYGQERPQKLLERLKTLPSLFPHCTHTAGKQAQYDFTADADTSKHMSAKTNKKKNGKVAPQVIGQAQPKGFCELLNIPYSTDIALKQYIQEHPTEILEHMVKYTFDCPNIYYNEGSNTIRFVVLSTPIDWTSVKFVWTKSWETWGNSTTLKVVKGEKSIALAEFQFHSSDRTNMAIRWCYDNFLELFKENLTITDL
jgi:hypothetical protein